MPFFIFPGQQWKENLGFDFAGSPFGKDHFDIWNFRPHSRSFRDMFTGYVFYLPIEKHIDSFGINDITKEHEREIYNFWKVSRASMGYPPVTEETIKLFSTVRTESSYEDLDQMIEMRDQWIAK